MTLSFAPQIIAVKSNFLTLLWLCELFDVLRSEYALHENVQFNFHLFIKFLWSVKTATTFHFVVIDTFIYAKYEKNHFQGWKERVKFQLLTRWKCIETCTLHGAYYNFAWLLSLHICSVYLLNQKPIKLRFFLHQLNLKRKIFHRKKLVIIYARTSEKVIYFD